MAEKDSLPGNRKAWFKDAREHEVEDTCIHELDQFTSGSKIKRKHYLSLRVLWVPHQQNIDIEKDLGIDYQRARKVYLERNKDWNCYITVVEKGLQGSQYLGTFDMLYDSQSQIENLDMDAQEEAEKVFSPIITRSMTLAAAAKRESPSTPTPASKTDLGDLSAKLHELALDSEEFQTPESITARSEIESASPMTVLEAKTVPLVADEAIVNTCLILLLRGICLRIALLAKAQWSLERKAFNFIVNYDKLRERKMRRQIKSKKGKEKSKNQGKGKGKGKEKETSAEKKGIKKLFEARTDGHFELTTGEGKRSLSILEVKAGERSGSKPQMQESAQMVSWIYVEPDMEDTETYRTFRRCMIVQDRHEIYLLIAEYDTEYLKYLHGDWDKEEDDHSFLTMHEIGPFIPTGQGHMNRLGALVLALSIQLVQKAQQGTPGRW